MSMKKKIGLFVFLSALVGMISNFYGKAENVNGSDAKSVGESQTQDGLRENEYSDDIASQDDVLEVILEREVTEVQDTEERQEGEPASLVCYDEGKNVYLQKTVRSSETTGFAKTLTDDSAIFSPFGKKAELEPVEGWAFPSLNITLEDGTKKQCILNNVFFSSIMDFRWIDEERIILEGHRNPSLNIYIVYNLKENDFEKFYGCFFTWDSNYSNLYYVETSPHWGSEPVPEKIIDQDRNIYYETEKGDYLINGLVFDEANEYMGFFVDTKEEKKNFGILNCQTKAILYEETDVHYDEVEIIVQ